MAKREEEGGSKEEEEAVVRGLLVTLLVVHLRRRLPAAALVGCRRRWRVAARASEIRRSAAGASSLNFRREKKMGVAGSVPPCRAARDCRALVRSRLPHHTVSRIVGVAEKTINSKVALFRATQAAIQPSPALP
jgi:hypothetical protein